MRFQRVASNAFMIAARSVVYGLGGMQVVTTVALAATVAWLAGAGWVAALVLGAILMGIWALRQPDFFRGKTLARRSDDLVLAPGDGRVPTFGLPDSGRMPEVIAPDLSNLPEGQEAIDAVTGKKVTKPKK